MTNRLTLDDYQAISEDTAVYPGKGSLAGLMYIGLGLGESGEAQGKIKKIFRDDMGPNVSRALTEAFPYQRDKIEALRSELGDILWYVAQAATELGLSLGDIAQANIDKLQSRKERGVLQGSGDTR